MNPIARAVRWLSRLPQRINGSDEVRVPELADADATVWLVRGFPRGILCSEGLASPASFLSDLRHHMRHCDLRRVCIPASVERLPEHCFCTDEQLVFVAFEWGSRLRNIPECSFSRCRSLLSIWIPASVEVIGVHSLPACE
jgi:hypothetical protein